MDPLGPPLGGTFRVKEVTLLDHGLFFPKIIFALELGRFLVDFGPRFGWFGGDFWRFFDGFSSNFATDAAPF